ncbi:MAG TPA: ABC transporter permease, partial [bacterium]|nr:ABC transporter permease [bacterium]
MNLFKQLIKKEFYHIIRDPRTLLIIFILPIIQILLFGYVITNEIKDTNVAIYDKSYDNVTRKIKSRIFAS